LYKSLLHRWFGSATPTPVQETTESLAQLGDAEAQFNLGVKFAASTGAAQDYAQAEFWYLKAAAQNHPMANFNLGQMYACGHGAPRDATKALIWIQKAADLGDAGAQYSLGNTHHKAGMNKLSETISESRIAAYKWFRLSAMQGYRGADEACEMVNIAMSREDVEEGRRQIAAFTVTKPALN
jgi:TPR repeat protein